MSSAQNLSIDGVELVETNGGMQALRISRNGLEGEIYLHGAHVTRWKPPTSEDVLFVSDKTIWNPEKAIRGGVPICFPWFGPNLHDSSFPQHGFARTRTWALTSVAKHEDAIVVELSDQSDSLTKALWPFDFVIKHRVSFGATLTMELHVHNTGSDPFTFEEAQHTYFSVSDVREIRIDGLDGTSFLDKTDEAKLKHQSASVRFTGEVDRAYLDTDSPLLLLDPAKKRRISILKANSGSTVVWNPWEEKARNLKDLGDDEWQQMVCIETCNIQRNAIRLEPGRSHSMQTEIKVESL